jgi:L-threonylcarbamoyladenylate synthase
VSALRRVRLDRLLESAEEIARLRELLSGGGVAAIPTETFYGLAADPASVLGIARIFGAKGRAEDKPLPVVFASRDQLESLGVESTRDSLDRWFEVWPAPLTVVLPIRRPIMASRGHSSLGVRIPALPGLVRLLESTGPLTATSANRAGDPPFSDPDAVAAAFDGGVDLLIDAGPTPGGKPSTVLDALADPPGVIRPGAFPWP